jgi:hypothetical protein
VWFRSTIELVERNDIGWAWWPLKKMGFNNPLEIKVAPGYQKIIDFWGGTGERPTADEAWAALQEQANNLKLENCIYHKDVVDAMFRQVKSNRAIPYARHLLSKQLSIKAADYDLGKIGAAYYDADTANYHVSTGKEHTPGNRGHVYRNDGVDIQYVNNEPVIDHIEKGEWWQYTIDVSKAGKYTIRMTVGSDNDTGKVSVEINGVSSPAVTVPNTGAATTFKEIVLPEMSLKKGRNVIRVKAEEKGFTFKTLTLSSGKPV